jgi:hypothetical protein
MFGSFGSAGVVGTPEASILRVIPNSYSARVTVHRSFYSKGPESEWTPRKRHATPTRFIRRFASLFRKNPWDVSLKAVILSHQVIGPQAPATRWSPNKEGTVVRKGKQVIKTKGRRVMCSSQLPDQSDGYNNAVHL